MRPRSISRPGLRIGLALGVLALAGSCWSAAATAAAWQKTSLSVPTAGTSPSAVAVAIGDSGEAVAVWTLRRSDGVVVESASRPSGGAWSAPVEISTPGQDVSRPKVAIDEAGEAVAVWVFDDGSHEMVQSAARPAAGAWSSPATLSPEPVSAGHPEIAVDGAGEAVVVWETRPPSGPGAVVSASRRPDGAWSAPVALAVEEGNATRPRVDISSNGEAVAIWEHLDRRHHSVIESAARPPGAPWSPPVTVSKGGDPNARNPEIAIDEAGEAVAVWEVSVGFRSTFVRGAVRSPGGKWASPTRISTDPASDHPFPRLAVNRAGQAVVTWDGGGGEVLVASRRAGRDWSRPRQLNRPSEFLSLNPDAGIDAAGNALVVWGRETFKRNGTEVDALVGASRRRGAAWSAPALIAGIPGGNEGIPAGRGVDGLPEVAVNSSGEAVVVWERVLRGKSVLVIEAAARP